MNSPLALGKLKILILEIPLEYWFSSLRIGFMISGYLAVYSRMISAVPSVDASS